MHPTQVSTPFHRSGWVYEEKVDGYRMVAYKEGRTVRLISRQGKEFTQRFPELAKAVSELGAESAILDTEVAVFDRQLISRFEPGFPLQSTPPPLLEEHDVAAEMIFLGTKPQREDSPLASQRRAYGPE